MNHLPSFYKMCAKCLTEKYCLKFSIDNSQDDGRNRTCIDCQKKEYRKKKLL